MSNIFTSGQAAKLCGVAMRTAAKWVDAGILQGYRIPGSQDRRIPRASLIQFIRENNMPMPVELRGTTALLVSDDRPLVDRLRVDLDDRLLVAECGFIAGRLFMEASPAIVIADTRIGAGFAREILRCVGEDTTARILLQAEDDQSAPTDAEGAAVEGWRRPFDTALLAERLRELLRE